MEPSLKKLKTSKEEDESKTSEKEREKKRKEEEESKAAEKEREKRRKEKEELEQFVKLFDEVLQQNKGNLSDKDIEEGVRDSKSFFQEGISDSCNKEKLNSSKILCGFFHRYSPLYAGKTRRVIIDALYGCEKLRYLFHRPSLKIVDVGSGAGSALVGLYSALYEENFPFNSLEITAMDYNKDWEIFFNGIASKLREGHFGNASKFIKEKEIKCSSVCFDMVKNDGYKKEKCLNEADIVFMKGFLSVLKTDDERNIIMKNISSAMKPGSLLLCVESQSYKKHFIQEEYNLSLVFYTKIDDTTSFQSENPNALSVNSQPPLESDVTAQASSFSLEDATSQSSPNESQVYDPVFKLKSDKDNYFNFSVTGVREYGPGFSIHSNQQIYILVKEEKKIN